MKRILAALAAIATVPFFVAPASAQETRTIPTSVDNTCSKDVTAQVKAFVSGGNGQLRPGCYIVNEKLVFSTQLDGQGATIRQTRAPLEKCNQHAGFLELKSNGSVKNLKLVREGPGGYSECHYAEHGLEIRGSSNTSATNLTMTNVWGDCLYMQRAQKVTIKDLDCVSNGRQGGAISAGRDVLIDGFKVRKSSRSGFDFEANGTSADDGIYNFEMKNFAIVKSNLIAFPSQGYNAPQDNIYIHDGLIGDSLSAFYVRQTRPSSDGCRGGQVRKNWRIENVKVDKVGAYGPASTVFCGVENVSVKNLTQPTGYVTFESSRGRLEVTNSCVKEVRGLAQTVPIQQSGNTTPPCGTSPPPPSSSTTTTQPPVPSSTPGTTPSTSPPPSTTPSLTPEQVAIRDAYIALRRICAQATWC